MESTSKIWQSTKVDRSSRILNMSIRNNIDTQYEDYLEREYEAYNTKKSRA